MSCGLSCEVTPTPAGLQECPQEWVRFRWSRPGTLLASPPPCGVCWVPICSHPQLQPAALCLQPLTRQQAALSPPLGPDSLGGDSVVSLLALQQPWKCPAPSGGPNPAFCKPSCPPPPQQASQLGELVSKETAPSNSTSGRLLNATLSEGRGSGIWSHRHTKVVMTERRTGMI